MLVVRKLCPLKSYKCYFVKYKNALVLFWFSVVKIVLVRYEKDDNFYVGLVVLKFA